MSVVGVLTAGGDHGAAGGPGAAPGGAGRPIIEIEGGAWHTLLDSLPGVHQIVAHLARHRLITIGCEPTEQPHQAYITG